MSRVLVLVLAALCVSALPSALTGFTSVRTALLDPGVGFVVATFDDDDTPDVAVVTTDFSVLPADPEVRLEFFSGDGDGGLTSEQVRELLLFGYLGNPSLVAEDFDDDGRTDLGLTRYFPQVWLNEGDFAFEGDHVFPTAGGEQLDLDFTDLDGDGDLDSLLLVDDFGYFIDTGINDGAGFFRNSSFIFAPDFPTPRGRLVAADMNGDGVEEYVLISSNAVHVSGVTGPGSVVLEGVFSDICVADFNEDGATDVAASALEESAVYVLLNDGTGEFPDVRRLRVGRRPIRVVAGDLRGGGHMDIVTLNEEIGDLTVLHGDGTARFGLGGTLAVLDDPVDLALADMDVDGDLDILVLGGASEELEVLLNPRVP